jgi:hypothetical protein
MGVLGARWEDGGEGMETAGGFRYPEEIEGYVKI